MKLKKDSMALKQTKLEFLLKPDHFDYVDFLLINLDFSFLSEKRRKYKAVCPLIGVQDNKDSIGIMKVLQTFNKTFEKTFQNTVKQGKKKNVLGVLPLYGNIWKIDGNDESNNIKYISSVTQKKFDEIKATKQFKKDFMLIKDDSTLFVDDLSIDAIKKKIEVIYDSFDGIGIWHIEYGNTEFYRELQSKISQNLVKGNILRVLIVKHFHGIRRIIGPHRIIIGYILSILILSYISLVLFTKLAGRENIILQYKIYFTLTAILLLLISILYIVTIPARQSLIIVENVILVCVTIAVIVAVGVHMYKLKQANDLP
jgi:hypothetical protein